MFRSRSTSSRGTHLAASDVALLYRELLGRTPSADEVAAQMAATDDWRELLAAMVVSDEFCTGKGAAIEPRNPSRRVNVWHPDLGAWTHPVGTASADGDVVVGRDGYVFLVGGSNAVLEQYQPGFAPGPDWAERWEQVVRTRREEARKLGVRLGMLIVPDKLGVLGDLVPPGAELNARPPASVISELHQVSYPIDQLAAVEGAYLRTDTHLSFAGNVALAQLALADLGVSERVGPHDVQATTYLSSGDLGSRFSPQIVEVMSGYFNWGAAHLVEDTWPQAEALGRHVGTYRMLRNDQAVDDGVVVVFGDSFAFPQPHYHGVAWYLAQHFRETHFVWSPFGWDAGFVRSVKATAVLCESAERFVPRPPADRIDVKAMLLELRKASKAAGLD
ncbi:hypothetical protein [Cellulomonas citrea]|uniref:hypothetical protein n=1 Tax=Cellulomonas citrea TaxID=1909423 RepID=UPI0013572079|nr:hypothetical protein [Cellulomonas citrea]